MMQDEIDLSTQWMQDGLGRMAAGDESAALSRFDQSADLRSKWPWRDDPNLAWLAAAAWINRAGALEKLTRRAEAIESLDQGIEMMSHADLGGNPEHWQRWLVAVINRATMLCDEGRLAESAEDFSRAASGVEMKAESGILKAILCINRARLKLKMDQTLEAWSDCREGLEILKSFPRGREIAGISVQARSVACRALAMLLEKPAEVKAVDDWIAVATDLTEEALEIVRDFGVEGDWIPDLVRYGAKIYRACQPQFLGAFAVEWVGQSGPLADDRQLVREMKNEISLAKMEVERRVLLAPHETDYVERQTQVMKALQAGEIGLMGCG